MFHCQNQEIISNKTITIDPTTPQLCRLIFGEIIKCTKYGAIFWPILYVIGPQTVRKSAEHQI